MLKRICSISTSHRLSIHSAVVFPVLGILVISKFGSLKELGKIVGKRFAFVFPILAFLAIGPGLAIPRNAAVSYEMAVIPFFPDASVFVRILYSVIFFSISYLLSVHPEKLVDSLGKILGPLLIGMMLFVTIGCFFHFPESLLQPAGNYQSHQFIQGFLDGYNTMDTIAALNFGAIVAINVKSEGIHDEKSIFSNCAKAGWIAGIFMFLVYAAMSAIGAISAVNIHGASNGAGVLSGIVGYLFGTSGLSLLACIYILSCLTTCIGLLCSCSEFFASISKFSYLFWVRLFAVISCIVSVIGLNQILEVSVPVLTAIYPIAMVLVILGLAKKWVQKFPSVPLLAIGFTGITSVIYALHSLSISIPFLSDFILSLPPNADLCWIIPCIAGIVAGICLDFRKSKN